MASGAINNSYTDLVVSVTGIAGPSGGGPGKPVGLVWFAIAQLDGTLLAEKRIFHGGGRSFVRAKTVETALALLLRSIRA